jgi:hypothetical protein
MKNFNQKNIIEDTQTINSHDLEKFEVIEDALLENISGAGVEVQMCMCWQFCDIPD